MMSESKHTPGPWNRVGFGIWTESDGNRRVACAEVDDGCGPYKVQTEEEAKANAQLIAAAPELLAVVRDLLDIVVFEYNNDPEREDLTSWRRAIDSALAAIEKAEGV